MHGKFSLLQDVPVRGKNTSGKELVLMSWGETTFLFLIDRLEVRRLASQ
jgi:hypothetical protein